MFSSFYKNCLCYEILLHFLLSQHISFEEKYFSIWTLFLLEIVIHVPILSYQEVLASLRDKYSNKKKVGYYYYNIFILT